jgi:hypothetical protein
LLRNAAERLLAGCLPPLLVDGQTVERPTILPLPGELPITGNVRERLAHLADLAQMLGPARDEPALGMASDTEARLLFNYLRGNIRAASEDLELLDAETTDLGDRLSVLCLRAVVRWALGKEEEAKQIIDYIVRAVGTTTERLEDTPLGPVVTKVTSPEQAWAGFLSVKAAQARALGPADLLGVDSVDPVSGIGRKQPLDLPEFPAFEPGGAAGPFAPLPAPDFDPPARP